MTKPMTRIHNTKTDEVILREMTDEEYAQYLEYQPVEIELIENFETDVPTEPVIEEIPAE